MGLLWQADGAARALTVAGALAYLLDVFAATGIGNIPMNTRLDATESKPHETVTYWPQYARRWTQLNHVRTASSVLTSLCWLAAAHIVQGKA